ELVPNSGEFTVTRSGDTASALTVSYAVTGTATSGNDYTPLPGTVTIPAGSATAIIPVNPVNDTAVESDETVIVTLSTTPAYRGGAPASAPVTIPSDDGAGFTISATKPQASELVPNSGEFTITRSG